MNKHTGICINSLIIVNILMIALSSSALAANPGPIFIAAEENKLAIEGIDVGGQFGTELVSGDFNNDGIDDLVISAPFSSTGLREWNGSVSIVFGSKDLGSGNFELANSSEEVNIFGANSHDKLGYSLLVGDFNGDGIDDIAMSSANALVNEVRTGSVYIINGRQNWDMQSFDLSKGVADHQIDGLGEGAEFGLSMSTIDIDKDDSDDIVIGAPGQLDKDGQKTGAIHFYLGGNKKFSEIHSSIYGHQNGQKFGSNVSVGKMSSGQKNSVVVSAHLASTEELAEAGAVYLYEASDDLDQWQLKANIFGSNSKDWFGFDLDTLDISGDGKSEIIASSFPQLGGQNYSRVYFFYSENVDSLVENENLNAFRKADMILENQGLIADFEVNSMGERLDVVLGEPQAKSGAYSKSGSVSIFDLRGKNSLLTIHGDESQDWFGYAIDSVDMNGDGFDDLAVGARYDDSLSSSDNGKVFIIWGNEKGYIDVDKYVDSDDNLVAEDQIFISRAELVTKVIESFELLEKKKKLIDSCYSYLEFCFFNFSAMTDYDGFQIEPELILYPDVSPADQYYENINTATILGLINGYLDEENSPFHPDRKVSRIQALKIVLSAAELVPPKYKFELLEALGSYEKLISQTSYFSDINAKISHMWWYPRYVNFAVQKNLIDGNENFRPDEEITREELNDLLERTLRLISESDEKEKL